MKKETMDKIRYRNFRAVSAVLMVMVFIIFVLSACQNSSSTENASSANNQGTASGGNSESATGNENNPEGQQVIEVTARGGGYSPRQIEAKAGMQTILRITSDGAYGCERAFVIPDLKIYQVLPENGITEFDLGVRDKGTTLLGVCAMGMYYFQIFFS